MTKWLDRPTLLVFVVALTMRLIVFAIHPYSHEPYDDSLQYDRIAWNIVQGNTFSLDTEPPYEPTARRPPGYPAFLSFWYLLFGQNYRLVKLIQCVLGALIPVFAYKIARRIFSDRVALFSGIAVGLWPPLALFSDRLMSETLFTLCLIVAVYAIYRLIEAPKWYWGGLAGTGVAIAALTRPEAQLLFPFLLAVPVVLGGYRRTRNALVIGAIAYAMLVVPWYVRNYVVFDRFIPLATGAEAVESRYEEREGKRQIYRPERQIYLDYLLGKGERAEANRKLRQNPSTEERERVEQEMGEASTNGAASGTLQRLKVKALFLVVRVYQLWGPTSYSQTFGLSGDFVEYLKSGNYGAFVVKASLLGLNFAGVVVGWLGILLSLRAWRRCLPMLVVIGYFFGIYTLIHAIARYRIPIMPYMLVFSVYAGFRVFSYFRAKIAAKSENMAEAVEG